MRPYRRAQKPVRKCQNHILNSCLGRASKAINTLWKDIHATWFREPPLPASVRILISLGLVWALVLPFFYIMIPLISTAAATYYLFYEEFPLLPPLPVLTASNQKLYFKAIKDIFRKTTFRLSMLVTLYDYVQTVRALGVFNGLAARYY